MEDQLERILEVCEMYESKESKIGFLLRQIEWFVQVNNAYEKQISKDREKKEQLKNMLLKVRKDLESENVHAVKEEILNALNLLEYKEQ